MYNNIFGLIVTWKQVGLKKIIYLLITKIRFKKNANETLNTKKGKVKETTLQRKHERDQNPKNKLHNNAV